MNNYVKLEVYHDRNYVDTHLCRVDSSISTIWTGPFSIEGLYCYLLLLPWFIRCSVFNANNVDPDQTPRSAASDLGPHCLPMPLLWDASHY